MGNNVEKLELKLYLQRCTMMQTMYAKFWHFLKNIKL